MFPAVDDAVIDFVNIARSERLPVTISHIKSFVEQSAKCCKTDSFSASYRWLQKLLCRSPVQPSLKLDGRGGSSLPVGTAGRMIEIRDVLSQYDPKNI